MNWLKEVGAASSDQALLAVVNDFLLQHPEDFWSWIPKGSRPTLVAGVEELHRWQRKLCDDLTAATMPNVRMQDLCVFFMRASARALVLEQRHAGSRASSNDALETSSEGSGSQS